MSDQLVQKRKKKRLFSQMNEQPNTQNSVTENPPKKKIKFFVNTQLRENSSNALSQKKFEEYYHNPCIRNDKEFSNNADGEMTISVVSYDVLASDFCKPQHFPFHLQKDPLILKWNGGRNRLISKELDHLNSDIICLQRVQNNDWNHLFYEIQHNGKLRQYSKEYKKGEHIRNYKGIYLQRTSLVKPHKDGCAILWDASKFEFERYKESKLNDLENYKDKKDYVLNFDASKFEFQRYKESKLNDLENYEDKKDYGLNFEYEETGVDCFIERDLKHDNIAQILKLRHKKSGRFIIIGNTYFYRNNKNVIKRQCEEIFREIIMLRMWSLGWGCPTSTPLLICGNFGTSQDTIEESLLGFKDDGKHKQFKSVYNSEKNRSRFTWFQRSCCHHDYIYYSPGWSLEEDENGKRIYVKDPRWIKKVNDFKKKYGEDRNMQISVEEFFKPALTLKMVLDLPEKRLCLPNKECGSDHVPLGSIFNIIKFTIPQKEN